MAERPEVAYMDTNPTTGPHTFMTSSKPNLPHKGPISKYPHTGGLGLQHVDSGRIKFSLAHVKLQILQLLILHTREENNKEFPFPNYRLIYRGLELVLKLTGVSLTQYLTSNSRKKATKAKQNHYIHLRKASSREWGKNGRVKVS